MLRTKSALPSLVAVLSFTLSVLVSSWAFSAQDRLSAVAYNNPKAQKNMLFIHGTPGSAEAFSEYMNSEKLKSNLSLISVDRLGFGKSRIEAETSLEKHSLSILRVLNETFASRKTICVGHSYGATLCLDLVARFPERFESAVLIAGAFNPHRRILKWYNYAASSWPLRKLLSRPLMNSNKEMYGLKEELLGLEKRLKKIAVPIMIIHGKKDKIVPYGDATWLFVKLEALGVDVQLKTYDSVGHFILWKEQDKLVGHLLELI